MDTIFYLLLGAGLLIALITGIITLISSLFRFLLGSSKSNQTTPSQSKSGCCPRCTTFLKPGSARCQICFWPESLARGDRSYLILAELEQQLLRYQSLDLLKADAVRSWISSLHSPPGTIPEATLVDFVPTNDAAERPQHEEQPSSRSTEPVSEDSAEFAPPAALPLDHGIPRPRSIDTTSDVDDPFRLQMPGQAQPPQLPPLPEVPPRTISEKERRLAALHSVVKPIETALKITEDAASNELWIAPAALQTIEQKGTHALDEQIPVSAPRRPAERTPLTTVLSAFLEEKNIRWGELIGGLLIICCSIALVISFWAQINERPLFKFSLFNGVTAAIFAMGFYTGQRWKIRTTSLGLLLIGALLTPLNFLAIAAYTNAMPPTDLLGLGGEAVSLVLFSTLVFYAAKQLTPGFALSTTIGLILPCLWQLLTRRFVTESASSTQIFFFAGVPLATYLIGMAVPLDRWRQAASWNERRAHRLFRLWLILTASTALPLALLLYKTGTPRSTLQQLSPLLVIAGLPALVIGVLSALKIKATALTKLRLAGMSLGLFGGGSIMAALLLAWPAVESLLPVLLVTIAVFGLAAWRLKLPAVYVPAGLSLMAVAILCAGIFRGELHWGQHDARALITAIFSMASGMTLAALSVGFFALAGLCIRVQQFEEKQWSVRLGQFAASVGFLLIAYWGAARTGDPRNATWPFAAYAVGLVAATWVSQRQLYGWLTSAVLLLTLVQAVVFRWGDQPSPSLWLVALLVHATLLALTGIALRFIANPKAQIGRGVLLISSLTTSLLAAMFMIYAVQSLAWHDSAIFTGWIAIAWLLLGLSCNHAPLLVAFQIAASFAVLLSVIASVSHADWYLAAKRPWLDPRFFGALALAAAALSLVWTIFTVGIDWLNQRLKKQNLVTAESNTHTTSTVLPGFLRDTLELWQEAQPGVFARVCSWLATGALFLLAMIAVVPGVAQEFTPMTGSPPYVRAAMTAPPASAFELPGVPHEHAAGAMTVVLLAVLIVTLVVRWVHCREVWQLLGLLLCLGCGVLLGATHWEPEVAVASAVRWLMSGLVLAGSLALWGQGALARGLARIGLRPRPEAKTEATAKLVRQLLLGMAALTYLGLMGVMTSRGLELPLPLVFKPGFETLFGVAFAAVMAGLLMNRWFFASDAIASSYSTGIRDPNTGKTLAISALIISLLTLWGGFAALSLAERPMLGPVPGSWFATLGNSISYGMPMLMLAGALFNFGWRERSTTLYFAAQLLLNLLLSSVYLINRIEVGGRLDTEALIELALANAALSATLSIIWYVVQVLRRKQQLQQETAEKTNIPSLLLCQVLLATVLFWLPLGPAITSIILDPAGPFWFTALGSWAAWVAGSMVLAANLLILPRASVRTPAFIGAAGTTLAALIPLSFISWDRGDWLVYHLLAASMAAASTAILSAETWLRWRGQQTDLPWRHWAGCLILVMIGLGFRALIGDPAAPWWTIGLWLAAAGGLAWTAGLAAQREPLWIIPWLVNAAASLAWIDQHPLRYPEALLELLWINVLAGTVSMALSLALELWCFGRRSDMSMRRMMPLHQVLAWLGIAALGTTTFYMINADLEQVALDTPRWLPIAALAALLVTTLACLWDAALRQTIAMLYCLGLVATGMFIDALDTQGQLFVLIVTVALAAYSLATSYLWSIRAGLERVARLWKIPVQNSITPGFFGESGQGWLVTANGLLSVIVTWLVFWSVFNIEENAWRLLCVQAILTQTFSLALLARGAVRSVLQYATLGMGVLFVLAWGFALLPLDVPAPLLHRTVAAAVAISLTVPIYGLGIVKILRTENEWTRAAQKLLPLLTGLAALLFLVVLGIEVWQFWRTGDAGILWPALLAVMLALILLAVAALAAAVLPGRDPLQLSERGKTAYVYAAEALCGLLFLHIRISLPWLFGGWLAQFWPLIVMGIAFVGVGFSEFCRRRRLMVLAEPLERTGALLPLLPVLGLWLSPSLVHGSFVLLTVGALYLVLGMLRKSLLFTGLALLAVNGSLWFYLQGFPGLEIYRHPQLWIIPPTLCVLIAAQLNRARLTDQQQTSVRYFASIVLYASSCADVFINGVAIAPWLPLVLAALSIAGVFAGILLRVRAFLYLGTAFLMVALFTMIWYAAVELERTWIWWVCGIVAGILIIALFGLFEKKRDDMLRVVERLKQWEA